MRTASHFHYNDLGRVLQARLGGARQKVVLVAPFITRTALAYALEYVPLDTQTVIYTRWRIDEVAASVSDPRILDLLEERSNATVHLHDALHAKAYAVDSEVLLCGSANLTQAALGLKVEANIEHLMEITPIPTAFFIMLRRLDFESELATKALQKKVLELAEMLQTTMPKPWLQAVGRSGNDQYTNVVRQPFPRFRAPDRLYDAYRSIAEITNTQVRETILDDLLLLNVPSGLDVKAFNQDVRQSLLQLPLVQRLDHFLDPNRRFGELTRWLRTTIPDEARAPAEAERCAQTIIRWLTYFAVDRYGCEPRPHSEILFKK